VSLLEVLVSIFVLSVGLLGVASMLPLGQYKMAEALKADRAGVCGRSAAQEVMVRDWLNPQNWVASNFYGRFSPPNDWSSASPPLRWMPLMPLDITGRNAPAVLPTEVDESRCIPRKDSFAIDPLFVIANNNWAVSRRTAWFPLYSVRDPNNNPAPNPGWVSALRRVSIIRPGWALFNFPGIPLSVARDIATWHDERMFSRPEDSQTRPRQMVLWDDGAAAVAPAQMGDDPTDPINNRATNNTVLKSLADDNYTWMATVTPLLSASNAALRVMAPGAGPDDALSYTDVAGIGGYEVSVVVFYNRNFQIPTQIDDPENPPQERSTFAVMVGGGINGGEVFLAPDSAVTTVTTCEAWLNIKKGDWLMLRGLDGGPPPPLDPPPSGPPFPNVLDQGRVVAKWYRVIAVSDETVAAPASVGAPVAGLWGRFVTLDGSDWNADTDGDGVFEPVAPAATPPVPPPGNNTFDWAEATLVDNVQGVYTSTIIFDQ
jgi:hypothetical protein